MPRLEAPTKFMLGEGDIPTHWYNIVPDLPEPPAPVLHPGTGQPIGPADLAPLFPMALILQEVSPEPRIKIPDEVRDVYRLWRPTPLYRAYRLEKALDTPARIHYKYEGVSPAGSHKLNTATAQEALVQMEKADERLRSGKQPRILAAERRVILFNLSGHGHFDMGAYDAYFAGQLQDYASPTEAIRAALKELPAVVVRG